MMRIPSRRRIAALAAALAAVAATGLALLTAPSAGAAATCQVAYRADQWTGGFVGYVTLTAPDAGLHGWTVTWTFTAGQRITSFWNAQVTQSAGGAVSAASLSWNGELAANASTQFGVQGSWTTSNPSPTDFAVNGQPCNGSTPPTTTPPTTAPPTTAPPTTTPPTTNPPTTNPPTTNPPTTQPPAGCSGALICDGFESQAGGAPSGAWATTFPDCSGTGTATVDTTVARTGTKSLRVNGGVGFCNHVFVRSSTALTGSVWFARFYMRHSTALPPSHVTFLAMRDAADGNRDLRMGGQNARLQWNRASDDATLPEQSPAGVALSVPLPTNQWTCVEFMVSGTNGQMQTWVNGTEVAGLHEDGVPTHDIDSQWLNRTWRPSLVDFKLGWESYGEGADTLWYDDVAVAGSRIGC